MVGQVGIPMRQKDGPYNEKVSPSALAAHAGREVSASDVTNTAEAEFTDAATLEGSEAASMGLDNDGVAAITDGDSRDIWQACCARLRDALPADEFATWIQPAQAHIVGHQVWLGVPNAYVKAQLENALLEKVRDALESILATESVSITVQVANVEELALQAGRMSVPKRHGTRGRTSDSVVERAQLDLFQLERRGQFVAVPINPQNEFPTLLTRLPVFVPGRAGKQRERLDHDNALPFETSWGTGRKFGPPLTVYDEDTLMALGRLRQNMLIGHPSNMPFPISRLYATHESADVHVHVVYCMLSDIQAMCGTSTGGRNNKLRLASVRRLAATKIEFNKETQDKVNSTGTTIDLVHVKWDAYEENAVLYVQFSPIMATWLERAYTYIDWNLRRKLRSDVGKAVHRFLSGQSAKYVIFTKKLQATIGHTGPYKHFMADLREALEQLQAEGWLREYAISGNGRKHPHKLSVSR